MARLSVCLTGHSRPLLSQLVFERAKDILDGYDCEFTFAYDRDPESPHDELIEIVKLLFDIKEVVISKHHTKRGELLNDAFMKSSGEYYIFLENDWYWVEDRIEDAIRALDEVDFVRMVRTPFKNFTTIKNGFCILAPETGYAYNFNPSVRKDVFLIGIFREDLNSDQLESLTSTLFNAMGKTAAVLDTDSLSHIGFVNSNGVLREQHFIREGIKPSLIEVVKWFESISKDRSHIDLFVEHLQTEVRGADKGVELDETFSSNIL